MNIHTTREVGQRVYFLQRSRVPTSIIRFTETGPARVTRVSTEIRSTGRQTPGDTRQQLWSVILEAGSNQLVENIASASAVASGGIERLQRLWTPPPLGMCIMRM